MSPNDTTPDIQKFPPRVIDRGRSQARSMFIGSAIDDAGLDPYEFRLYAHLKRRAQDGEVWERQEQMAEVCGISRKTVNEVLKRLGQKGWVHQEGRTYKGQRTSNLIVLLEPPCNPELHGQVTQSYTAMSPTVTAKGTPHQGTPHQGLKEGTQKPRAGQNPPQASEADGQDTPSSCQQPTETAGKGTGQGDGTNKKDVPPAAPLDIPPVLLARPGWEESWGAWLAYRRGRKLTLSPMTLKAQLHKLAAEPDPIAVIEQSITNGWAGLFPLKTERRPPQDPNTRAVDTAQRVYRAITEEPDNVPF